MKKLLFMVLLLQFLQPVFAQNLSIKDAINYALSNNSQVKSAKELQKSASFYSNASVGNFLPKIDVSALAVKLDNPISLNLNDIRTAIIKTGVATHIATGGTIPDILESRLESSLPAFEKKLVDDNFVRVMATIAQPIFTGFKVSANSKIKGLEKEVGDINFENAKNKAISTTIEDYYRAKLAESVVSIRSDAKQNIEKHVYNARQLHKNGVISKANLLRAEVAFADSVKDYETAIGDKNLAYILLDNTLGIKTSSLTLNSPMEMFNNLKDVDFYINQAIQNNNSIKLLNIKKSMIKQKKMVAVGELLPTISAVGEYQILQDKLTTFEPKWAIGLNASMNIFSGGKQIYEIKAANAQMDAINAQIEDVKNLIYTAVKKLYHQCQTAKNTYNTLNSNEKLALENIKLYASSFKEGMATSLEVVDSQLALTKIKIDKARAVFDYNTSFAQLLDICSLSQKELEDLQ